MYGLGKQRTKLGKWLDSKGISQEWLVKKTKLSRTTISSACSDVEYDLSGSTMRKILEALRSEGYDVKVSDFWEM